MRRCGRSKLRSLCTSTSRVKNSGVLRLIWRWCRYYIRRTLRIARMSKGRITAEWLIVDEVAMWKQILVHGENNEL